MFKRPRYRWNIDENHKITKSDFQKKIWRLVHKQIPGSTQHGYYTINNQGRLVLFCEESSVRYWLIEEIIKNHKEKGWEVIVTEE
jgi:hypothetical protein